MGFNLEIITPYGKYFSDEVDFLRLTSSVGTLGILPRHAPLVSDVVICQIDITKHGKREVYATSGGLIYVKKEKTILLLDSIESKKDIDLERAIKSKERAENRLKEKDAALDLTRAQASLYRALNRIHIAQK